MGTEDASGSSKQLRVHPEIDDDKHSDCHPRDISQISKHLEIVPEPLGGSETSKHPEAYTQVTLGIRNSDHIYIYPKVIDGNGSRDFKIRSEVVDRSGSSKCSETHPAVIGRIDSSKLTVMHPDTTSNQSDPTKKLRPPSSSSVSSTQDLFQLDTEGLSESRLCSTFSPRPEVDSQPALIIDENNAPGIIDENNAPGSNYSRSLELDHIYVDITSTSQFSQVNDESAVHDIPPTQSPPIQVMERPGGYDPLRIPSSIFERSKSIAPEDWSTASNDSLFSIHIGNNSLSRENFLMLGGDTGNSGEFMFSPNRSVPVVGTECFEVAKSKATGESDGCLEVEIRETTEGQSKEWAPPATVVLHSPSLSHQSNDSAHSFAFPIEKKKFFFHKTKCKGKKCAWPSCYCSDCSCTFCYCSWPSYHFSWPSCYCSNCSWAFCYCWNCSPKRWCFHSSATLIEGPRSNSVKAGVGKQQQKARTTEVTLKSAASNCLSCFSSSLYYCCCCRCCSRCSCSHWSCSRSTCSGCSCSGCSCSYCSCPRCSCHCCWCC